MASTGGFHLRFGRPKVTLTGGPLRVNAADEVTLMLRQQLKCTVPGFSIQLNLISTNINAKRLK